MARSTSGTQDENLSVKTGSSLTFTTSNWNTDQTVTLQAAEDDDGDNGTADFNHTANGGGYGSVTGTVRATESDNDTRGFTFTPTSVSVGEGSTASYKVKLKTKPSASVTVSVARSTGGTQDENLSVKTGSSLTFTTSNWNTDQTVTLQAAEDDDGDNGTADFSHTANGGGYGSVTGTVRATESDNDTRGFTFTPTSLSVGEGSTASYKVKLKTKPSASVTVSVARSTGGTQDENLSVKTGSSLTFTTSNWSTDQTVTLQAAEDDDGDNGTADFSHTANGGGYGSVTGTVRATESDNDTRGFTFTPTSVSVGEGSTASYKVKLNTKPSASVTVSVARSTGGTQDENLSVKTGSSLTFTTSNWSTDQTVTLQAAEDDDGDNGTADFKHTANGGGYGSVTGTVRATESDNDTRGFTFTPTSVSVGEGSTASYKVKLKTKPSASVTVSVARSTSGTQDENLSVKTGSSLTFTTSNWNTDQTVTLQAAEDDDGDNGTADFSHTANGGGYGSVTGTVRATESDNDTRGFTFTPTSLSVGEGSTASYKVKLKTKPSASVTVSVARSTSGTQDENLSVKTGSSLTFTTSNWSTDQTVTLQAAEDDDGDNGTADFKHTANGGGYGSVTGTVRATEADNDTRGFTFTPTSVSVGEGSTASYKVKLKTKPSASVTVSVARSTSGTQDENLSVKTGSSLTFTTSNWSTDQTVTLQAAEDDDGDNGTADFAHTANGGGYGSVTGTVRATESDNDTRGFTFTPTSVSVGEGSTASYKVKLNTKPSANVIVSVARSTSGTQDENLSVKTGSSLTFTTSNWSTDQTVTLQAAEDDDGDNGTADFNHTANGGGYGSVTGTVQATESDNDTRGFTFTPTAVSVTEGSTNSYKVKLNTKPSDSVTVSVARSTTGTQDNNLSVKTGSSLTFTTSNWDTDQTVTLQAAEDDDGENGTADFKHTATGGGYDSATGTVRATESDNDTPGITLSTTSLTVNENDDASYKVRLATEPSDSVTVSVARSTTGTHDTDLSVKTGASLTFTTSNWNTDQTVTIEAGNDNDHTNGTATFDHTASGGGYDDLTAQLTATESDDDSPGITLSTTTLTVNEGGDAGYQVRLATQPTDDVTVTVARKSGNDQDSDLSVKSGGSLTFTTSNWSTDQAVTLQAGEDGDALNGTALFTHTAAGGGYDDASAELTATEADNDTVGITLSPTSLTVNEGGEASYQVTLSTQPSDDVAVSVTRTSGDTDLSVKTGGSLTFTTGNWSTGQAVTIQAAADADGLAGQAVFTHAASGGGYDDVTVALTATEADSDNLAILLSAQSLTVPEGGATDYGVKLASRPAGDVTVAVTRASGDSDLTVKAGGSLTFTTGNWSTNQTVTIQAAADWDNQDGSAIFRHTASGGGWNGVTADLTATEGDTDYRPGIAVSASAVALNEGGADATYTVNMEAAPASDVTVTVQSADTGAVTASPATLTFTPNNYATGQTITLSPQDDEDATDESVAVTHTATGYSTVTVQVTVRDDDGEAPSAPVPEPPEILAVVPGEDGTLTVDWAPGAGGTRVIAYQVEYRGSNGEWVTLDVGTRRKVDISELVNGVVYEFRVRARTAGGWGPWSDILWAMPVDVPPRVLGIEMDSRPLAGDWYGRSEEVRVRVLFSETVTVTPGAAPPWLGFRVGREMRQAAYWSGSGSEALTFAYRVAESDFDGNGVGVPANTLAMPAGTVLDGGGNEALPQHPGLPDQPEHKVDGAPPKVVGLGIVSAPADPAGYRPGEWIEPEVRFNEPVLVTGEPAITLIVGNETRRAIYAAGSGEPALRFRYRVDWGDWDPNGVAFPANAVAESAAGIRDRAGNAGTLEHEPRGDDPWHKVRAVDPPEALLELPDLTLVVGAAPALVDLAPVFEGAWSYEAASSAPHVASVELSEASLAVRPLREGVAEVRVTARNVAGSAERRFKVTVITDPAEIAAMEAALEGLGRGILSGVSQTIVRRLESGPGGTRISLMPSDQGMTPFASDAGGIGALSGMRRLFLNENPYRDDRQTGAPPLMQFDPRRDPYEISSADLTAPGGGPAGTPGGGSRDGWSLWGSGRLQTFVGGGTRDTGFEGHLEGPFVGLDVKRGRWLAGVAMAGELGRAEYSFAGETEGTGAIDIRLASAYPYLAVELGAGSAVWGIFGTGSGTAEAERHVTGAGEVTDLRMRLWMGGFRHRVAQRGRLDLAFRGGRRGGAGQHRRGAGGAREPERVPEPDAAGARRVVRAAGGPLRAAVPVRGGRGPPRRRRRGVGRGPRVLRRAALRLRDALPAGGAGPDARHAQRRGIRGTGPDAARGTPPTRRRARALAPDRAALGGRRPRSGDALAGRVPVAVGPGIRGRRRDPDAGRLRARAGVRAGVLTPFGEVSSRDASHSLRLGLRYALAEAVRHRFQIEIAGERAPGAAAVPAAYRFFLFGTLSY